MASRDALLSAAQEFVHSATRGGPGYRFVPHLRVRESSQQDPTPEELLVYEWTPRISTPSIRDPRVVDPVGPRIFDGLEKGVEVHEWIGGLAAECGVETTLEEVDIVAVEIDRLFHEQRGW